jgi:hypothetical protein
MAELLQSYNKINKIMKLHGHSNEYKQCYKQLNENEKYVIKKLKIIKNNNQQKERKEKEIRVNKVLEQYMNTTSETSDDNTIQMEKDKATEIRNKMETIIKELNNNIINK